MVGQHSLTLCEVMISELQACPSRTRICKSGSTFIYFYKPAIYYHVNLYELFDKLHENHVIYSSEYV